MIKFKQKEFVAPLVGAALSMAPDLVNAGINAVQNNQQNKAQQEALEQQKKQQEQQNKLLNKIAKKDPGAAANVMAQQNQPQQQQFSLKTYTRGLREKYKQQAKDAWKDISSAQLNSDDFIGFGKDIGRALWRNKHVATRSALVTAAGTGGLILGKKIAEHLRKRDERNEAEEREYSDVPPLSGRLKTTAKDILKRTGKHVWRVAKDNKGSIMLTAGIAAASPIAGYLAEKEMKRQMAEDLRENDEEYYRSRNYSDFNFTAEEKERRRNAGEYFDPKLKKWIKGSFSLKGRAKRLGAGVRRYYRNVKNDPLKKIIEWNSLIRPEKLNKVSEELNKGGSGSRLTKLVSDTVKNHPKTSMLIGSAAVALGTAAKIKAARAVSKKIDNLKKKNNVSFDNEYEIDD